MVLAVRTHPAPSHVRSRRPAAFVPKEVETDRYDDDGCREREREGLKSQPLLLHWRQQEVYDESYVPCVVVFMRMRCACVHAHDHTHEPHV